MKTTERSQDQPLPHAEPAAAPKRPPAPRVKAVTLLAGAREAIIEHRDEEYRLRLTSKGKLILTK
jgi:hemin uptake protein HemP